MTRCSLCGYRFSGFGHNPEPVKPYRLRCCDLCNDTVVIPARMAGLTRMLRGGVLRGWDKLDTTSDEQKPDV